jgi:hypothetical protein
VAVWVLRPGRSLHLLLTPLAFDAGHRCCGDGGHVAFARIWSLPVEKKKADGSEMGVSTPKVVDAQVDHRGTLQLWVTEGRVASEESGGRCALKVESSPESVNPLLFVLYHRPDNLGFVSHQMTSCQRPQSRLAKNAVGV